MTEIYKPTCVGCGQSLIDPAKSNFQWEAMHCVCPNCGLRDKGEGLRYITAKLSLPKDKKSR